MSDHTPQGISGGETHTGVSGFLPPGLPAGGAPELNESQGTGRKQPGEEERRGRVQGDRKHRTEAWQKEGAWLVRGSSRRLQGSASSPSQTPAQLKPRCLLLAITWCLPQAGEGTTPTCVPDQVTPQHSHRYSAPPLTHGIIIKLIRLAWRAFS